MKGEGVVVKLSGSLATVSICRASACGHDCGECRLCQNPKIEVEVSNPIGAKVGDRVAIGADTSSVLKTAFALYILPIIGAMILYIIKASFKMSSLFFALCLILWIAIWFALMKYINKNKLVKNCVLEVIDEKN